MTETTYTLPDWVNKAPVQFQEILEMHDKWLKDIEGGKRADLRDANLRDADLWGADLRGANLRDANLENIRNDIINNALNLMPNEVPALRQALVDGKVDGAMYNGECGCLFTTLARASGVRRIFSPGSTVSNLKADSSSARERWFMGIRKGDTTENSQIVKTTVQWIDEWIKEREDA